MNHGLRSLSLLLALCILPVLAQDEVSPARDLLNSAFSQLKSGKGWASDDFGDPLKKILTDFPDSPEAKTASTMYVPYLMQKGSYDDAMSLATSVVGEQPNTWQSSFALLNRVSILEAQGKKPEALQAAIEAVPAIESSNLRTVKDPDFTSFLQSTGLRKSGIKDGVLGLAASQLIENGATQEALPFLSQIHDPKIKALVTQNLSPEAQAAAASVTAAAPTPAAQATGAADGASSPFGVSKK